MLFRRSMSGSIINGLVDSIPQGLGEVFDDLFCYIETFLKKIEGFVHLNIIEEIFGFHIKGLYLADHLLGIVDELLMHVATVWVGEEGHKSVLKSNEIFVFLQDVFFQHREEDVELNLTEVSFHYSNLGL